MSARIINGNEGELDGDVQTIERQDGKTKEPALFKVFLLNDDYTTMDFVVSVLERIFKKNPSEAMHVMLAVHNQGQAVCGIYTREIAETKVEQVHQQARAEGHPLKCYIEEA
jgi:ATP-dependent Clp protease adaptor protein ClpS